MIQALQKDKRIIIKMNDGIKSEFNKLKKIKKIYNINYKTGRIALVL